MLEPLVVAKGATELALLPAMANRDGLICNVFGEQGHPVRATVSEMCRLRTQQQCPKP
jgi:hypothetical protein